MVLLRPLQKQKDLNATTTVETFPTPDIGNVMLFANA